MNQNIARNWVISPNLGQKIKSYLFWLKIGKHGVLEVLIPNPDLDFWNSNPKIHFWENLGPKIQSCFFCLKIGAWHLKDADSESRLRFLKFRPQNPFLGKFGSKNSKLSVLSENWYTWYLKVLILIPTLVLWISNPNFLFEQIWAKKVKVVRFIWKMTHMVSWKCRFRIQTSIFEILNPEFIFGQIWKFGNFEKVKVSRFSWKLALMASSWCWFLFQD